MNNKELAAKTAFDHSATLNKVFVTADCVAFILETDANWHVKSTKLDDKTVTPFDREDVVNVIPQARNYAALSIADLVTLIDASKDIDHVKTLTTGDERPEITSAAIDRIKELEALNS